MPAEWYLGEIGTVISIYIANEIECDYISYIILLFIDVMVRLENIVIDQHYRKFFKTDWTVTGSIALVHIGTFNLLI